LCDSHDFNDEIGGVKFTKTHPEWQEEGVYDEWEQYARESFQAEVPDAGDEDLSEHEIQDRRKQKADKVEVILETSDGIPILPAITADNMPKLPVLKSVIRTYLNKHYRK
jgi:hypothetical protein